MTLILLNLLIKKTKKLYVKPSGIYTEEFISQTDIASCILSCGLGLTPGEYIVYKNNNSDIDYNKEIYTIIDKDEDIPCDEDGADYQPKLEEMHNGYAKPIIGEKGEQKIYGDPIPIKYWFSPGESDPHFAAVDSFGTAKS